MLDDGDRDGFGSEKRQSDEEGLSHFMGRRTLKQIQEASSAADRVAIFAQKIAGLSDELGELHAGHELERNTRFERVRQKVVGLEDRLSAWQNISSLKFKEVKDQIMLFQDELDKERSKSAEEFHAKDVEIKQFDKALQGSLETEQLGLRHVESRILNHFEHKVSNFRDERTREFRGASTTTGNLRRYLEVDVPKLYAALRDETNAREVMEKQMLARAMEEVQELQTTVMAEKKARQETEEVLLRMMEDAVVKMQNELAFERRERKSTEQQMSQLLQDTCHKLKNSSPSEL
jgi:hypothetical protein